MQQDGFELRSVVLKDFITPFRMYKKNQRLKIKIQDNGLYIYDSKTKSYLERFRMSDMASYIRITGDIRSKGE